jgi:hypothetical protein
MTLPFALPQRPPVTRLRGRSTAELRAETGERTQDLPGFEPQWRDIVHYIVGITEEIWSDMAVDRIRATYAADCVIHTSMGTSRGVDGVIAGTVQSLWAFTDFTTDHLNVAWSAEGEDFYTSHLGFARSTNTGATLYGPATGRSLARHFVADCVSRDNKIHTEWLARDNATGLIQMGLQRRWRSCPPPNRSSRLEPTRRSRTATPRPRPAGSRGSLPVGTPVPSPKPPMPTRPMSPRTGRASAGLTGRAGWRC